MIRENPRRPIRVAAAPPIEPAMPPVRESTTALDVRARSIRRDALLAAVNVHTVRPFADVNFWGTVDAFEKYLTDGTMSTNPEEK